MIVYFNEKTNRLEYDKVAVDGIPDFQELVKRFGWDAFMVIYLITDYGTPYRYLEPGKERIDQILIDWKKRKDTTLSISLEKLSSPIFTKAIERYEEISYNGIRDEYVTLEAALKEDLRIYREQYAAQPTKTVKNKKREADEPDEKQVAIQHDPKDRKVLREVIEDTQNRLAVLRPLLFEKSQAISNQKRNLRTIRENSK
jgi:stalled ribosome rescue protein Dom34